MQLRTVKRTLAILASVFLGGAIYLPFRVNVPPPSPIVCNDGWPSPSIGRLGACSHHGGVSYSNSPNQIANRHNGWVMLFALIAGFTVYAGIDSIGEPEKTNPPLWTKNRNTIDRALRNGRCIAFEYNKKNSNIIEKRLIKPDRYTYLRNRGYNAPCVVGYCYLRKQARTFAVERMSNIELADPPY